MTFRLGNLALEMKPCGVFVNRSGGPCVET